ncbi:helix-turn-helix domain-containing protein [Streptomyces cadmiisoli]|uniref:helix-turn-helix domain-containing protein n=1 Tax=Streptomyces cadmiisoli TaxID=2184053 RepID=UPI00365E9675
MNEENQKDVEGSPRDRERASDFKSCMNLTPQQALDASHVFQEWEGGPFSHLTDLSIPDQSAHRGFKFSANGLLFDKLLSAKVYCDSLTGVSGSNQEQDPIVADLVTSGRIVFTAKGVSHDVTPGRICIRDTRASWDFSCSPGTRLRVISVPRHLVFSQAYSPGALNQAIISDVKTPEVRFLLNFLEAIEKSRDDLDRSHAAQDIAVDACASVFSGMLSDRSIAGLQDHPNAILAAARNFIEKNLDRHDLSPALVARTAGVSVRTLHRFFSDSNDSVMAFTRRRRLQKAHAEMMSQGSAARISEIAARWHFADSSHFIRHFKSFYGATPAAYLRNHSGSDRRDADG